MPDLSVTLHRYAERLYADRDGDLDVADALSSAASVLSAPEPAGARKKLVAVIAKGNHRPADLEMLNRALTAFDQACGKAGSDV